MVWFGRLLAQKNTDLFYTVKVKGELSRHFLSDYVPNNQDSTDVTLKVTDRSRSVN